MSISNGWQVVRLFLTNLFNVFLIVFLLIFRTELLWRRTVKKISLVMQLIGSFEMRIFLRCSWPNKIPKLSTNAGELLRKMKFNRKNADVVELYSIATSIYPQIQSIKLPSLLFHLKSLWCLSCFFLDCWIFKVTHPSPYISYQPQFILLFK